MVRLAVAMNLRTPPLAGLLRGFTAQPVVAEDDELERLLAAHVRAGVEAWPALKLAPEAFVARIAHHWGTTGGGIEWLRDLRGADLFLASACLERVPLAIETFDRELLSAVPAILARGNIRDLPADEIRQRVRERLFVGASKIGDYSGRGSLAGWLQVVTLRIAIDVARQQQSAPIPTDIDDAAMIGPDPELQMIKDKYGAPFKVALRAALAELPADKRALLRQHFIDGVTLDALAAQLGVHRATVARRIAQAREEVFDGVRARLQAELGLDRAEFDELVGLLRSRLELSLSALVEPRS